MCSFCSVLIKTSQVWLFNIPWNKSDLETFLIWSKISFLGICVCKSFIKKLDNWMRKHKKHSLLGYIAGFVKWTLFRSVKPNTFLRDLSQLRVVLVKSQAFPDYWRRSKQLSSNEEASRASSFLRAVIASRHPHRVCPFLQGSEVAWLFHQPNFLVNWKWFFHW